MKRSILTKIVKKKENRRWKQGNKERKTNGGDTTGEKGVKRKNTATTFKRERPQKVSRGEREGANKEGIVIDRSDKDESLVSPCDEDVLTSHATYPGFIA